MTQAALFALRKQREQDLPIDLQIRAANLPEPESEYRFHPVRKWAFDRAWPTWKIAFEIEGGGFGRLVIVGPGTVERRKGKSIPIDAGTSIRIGGRHNTGQGAQADCEKYSRAAILGWLVIRATTTMIRDGLAITLLEDAFRAKGYAA